VREGGDWTAKEEVSKNKGKIRSASAEAKPV
jgi:hypothetical protein